MTIREYIMRLDDIEINTSAVRDVEDRYHFACPDLLKKILSNAKESVFLEGEKRVLSLAEILNASRNLHVDFIKEGMIPVIDCYDNDFAVYCINGEWALFNIVDGCKYDEDQDLEKLLER